MDPTNHAASGTSSSSSSSSRSSSSSQPPAAATFSAGDLDRNGEALRSLIRRIKEHGVDQEVLRDVMGNLVAFSTHWLGSYAVEACILRCPTPAHRGVVASAFAALRDDELAQLVQDEYGACVLQRFLQSAAAAKDGFLEQEEQEQARELARRIEELPGTVLEQAHAMQTVKVARRMYTRRGD
ncbi:hypothetical protein U9M48_006416 [Paspalum notatum var. saurae]|uniref:PUM-HD domain-containing protein n=1 Tax=Paspalum notatum var. saurae TaxID=547442 RepID=A0AAQ3SJF0_PASNO